ncbi:MAG: DNA-directed RNA polymerase subunit omega [Thermoanaerobaculum sp.]|nr:DNA-directed RNA polymerase subunit omega [Thermoanaerobaculum sp.]MDW7967538.1 DNA-directed RNA polymerase subunit omega [Thermoanaerobaculum sp.]
MNDAPKPDSTFRLVLLAAKRAEQLMEGAKPRLREPHVFKPTTLALREVEEGLVPWYILTREEYEQLREQELLLKEKEKEREATFAVPPPPVAASFVVDEEEEEEEEEELEEAEPLPADEDLAELEHFAGDELLDEEG